MNRTPKYQGKKFTENATGDYDIDINVGKSILYQIKIISPFKNSQYLTKSYGLEIFKN